MYYNIYIYIFNIIVFFINYLSLSIYLYIETLHPFGLQECRHSSAFILKGRPDVVGVCWRHLGGSSRLHSSVPQSLKVSSWLLGGQWRRFNVHRTVRSLTGTCCAVSLYARVRALLSACTLTLRVHSTCIGLSAAVKQMLLVFKAAGGEASMYACVRVWVLRVFVRVRGPRVSAGFFCFLLFLFTDSLHEKYLYCKSFWIIIYFIYLYI